MAKILVVDDAEYIRRWCERALTAEGHEVIEAADGDDAIAMYQAERPDAVLLDVTMPRMDGITALRELRRLDPEARVAMLTAMGKLNVIIEARKLGARDFVVKPCESRRLVEAVNRILS